MKKVYIAHPLRGAEREKNVEEVTRICQKITELFPDVLPISPIHSFSFLDDCGAEGEKKALELCLEMVKTCDELWLFGDWRNSEGCVAENRAFDGRVSLLSPQACAKTKKYGCYGRKRELIDWLLSEVYAEPEPLKPCPFCGGAAVLNTEYGFIACGNDSCFMTCSINWGNRAMDRVKTRAEAIAAWNRRGGE